MEMETFQKVPCITRKYPTPESSRSSRSLLRDTSVSPEKIQINPVTATFKGPKSPRDDPVTPASPEKIPIEPVNAMDEGPNSPHDDPLAESTRLENPAIMQVSPEKVAEVHEIQETPVTRCHKSPAARKRIRFSDEENEPLRKQPKIISQAGDSSTANLRSLINILAENQLKLSVRNSVQDIFNQLMVQIDANAIQMKSQIDANAVQLKSTVQDAFNKVGQILSVSED